MLDESLRNGHIKVVGLKQTRRALEKGGVRVVYIAVDADSRLLQPIKEMCRLNQIQIEEISSMLELGKACGIKVGAAMAAVLEN